MINFEGNYETEIRKIRNAVFTKEQRVNSNADFDGEDKNAIQILIKMNDQFAGTGRMLTDGHIGRIAVLKLFRGNGVGQKIIETFSTMNCRYAQVVVTRKLSITGVIWTYRYFSK